MNLNIMNERNKAIDLLVKNKGTAVLEFSEPWPATAENGALTAAPMLIRTTVENCINIQRHRVSLLSAARKPETDHELLDEFMLQQFAYVVDPGDA